MERKKFHEELKAFEILFPGGNLVKFGDGKSLLHFVKHQYPEWKDKGNVTSIPVARIPRLFLHCDQITEPFDKRYKGLDKGEQGEIKIYSELLKSNSKCDYGLCVFPNVDGNTFSSKDAHVEIDMVVVHPCKGIFVISVKNTTTIKPKDVVSDMNKHVQFIRWLFEFDQNKLAPNQHQCLTPNGKDTFNSPSCKSINTTNTTNASKSLQSNLPIHGLLITHRIDIGEKGLEKLGYFTSQENEFRLVFQPEDMKNFQSKWQSILSGIP